MEADWRRLSGGNVACICLQDRDDRWKAASARFHTYGLCRLVRFYRPVKPTPQELSERGIQSGGAYGCWRSHGAAARIFYDAAAERAILFEDDVDFLPAAAGTGDCRPSRQQFRQFGRRLARAAALCQTGIPNGWHMLYLGHFPYPFCGWPVKIGRTSLIRTHSALMHAYILSRSGMQRIAEADFCAFAEERGEETGIDEWVSFHLRQYAIFPQFAVQSWSASSNFRKRANGVAQALHDWFFPQAVDFYRRHTLLVEVGACILTPLVALVLIFALAFVMWRLAARR
jgi:hypothetical protein